MGEREGVERRGEGKEKVEGMTEGRAGGKKACGIRMGGGIAPMLYSGDRRHWAYSLGPLTDVHA